MMASSSSLSGLSSAGYLLNRLATNAKFNFSTPVTTSLAVTNSLKRYYLKEKSLESRIDNVVHHRSKYRVKKWPILVFTLTYKMFKWSDKLNLNLFLNRGQKVIQHHKRFKKWQFLVFTSWNKIMLTDFLYRLIDAHGLKIQGRGYGMFLPKLQGGVKGFRKNCQGGPPILRFIAFLLTSFSKICLGGGCCFIPSPPPLPPLCASMYRLNEINLHNRCPTAKFANSKEKNFKIGMN